VRDGDEWMLNGTKSRTSGHRVDKSDGLWSSGTLDKTRTLAIKFIIWPERRA
jgi:hypothetical protein